MTLRIIEADSALDAAFAQLEATLTAWAGGRGDAWERGDGGAGASFSRSQAAYLWLERRRREIAFGAALSVRDKDLFHFEIDRQEPARDKRRIAAAQNEAGEAFLLIGLEALKGWGIAEPLRRLAGAPAVKRAQLSGRDYVLIGPVTDARSAEALMSLAALHPRFEAQMERPAPGGDKDDQDEADIYAVSHGVARTHRAAAKVTRAVFERLTALGYYLETVELGALTADLAMSRGEDTVVFEIRSEAEVDDLQTALGRLALLAPLALGLTRVIALPAPRDALGAQLDPYKQAFEEMKISLVFYDFRDGEVSLVLDSADPGLQADVRLALA